MQISLGEGESWQRAVGPYFVYLNKASDSEDTHEHLWSDAKNQVIYNSVHIVILGLHVLISNFLTKVLCIS